MSRHHDQLEKLSETDLLARFIWNEAREEGLQGKLAVAHVVMNSVRAREYHGSSIPDVILRGDDLTGRKAGNLSMVQGPNGVSTDREFALCKAIAELATRGHPKNDPTDGATHFHNIHSIQTLQFTELQARVLEAITPEKIDSATLLDLVKAFAILKKAELGIKAEPFRITGLLEYLMELERREQDGSLGPDSTEVG